MKKLIMGRGTGKTTRLIQESARTKYPIIVASEARARYVRRLADDMKLEIPYPIAYYNLQYIGHPIGGCYVDDYDDVFTVMMYARGANVQIATVSPD